MSYDRANKQTKRDYYFIIIYRFVMFLDTSAWTVWMFPKPNILSHKPVQTVLSQLGENFKKVAENQVQSIDVIVLIKE